MTMSLTLAGSQAEATGQKVGTDKDLVVFVEKMDTLARSTGLAWTSFTYQGFAAVTAPGPGYPPNLKLASFTLTAKGTWSQFLAFVDVLEHYPGVVSLGEPLDLPFLGGTGAATSVTIPIRFYLNTTNDPSWMIQTGGFAATLPPTTP